MTTPEVHEAFDVRVSGDVTLRVRTIRTTSGAVLIELGPEGAEYLRGSIRLRPTVASALARSLKQAVESAAALARPVPAESPTVASSAPRFLGKIGSGTRALSFRQTRTLDGRLALVIDLSDRLRGDLGAITLTAGPLRHLERVFRRVVPAMMGEESERAPDAPALATESATTARPDAELPTNDEVLISARAEPRAASSLEPAPIRSRYAESLPPRSRRTAP